MRRSAAAAAEERGGTTPIAPASTGNDDKTETPTGGNVDRSCGNSGIYRPLSCPGDATVLTPLLCLVRSQLEVFAVSPDIHGDVRYRQMAGRIDLGRVGVRCVHCIGSRTASAGGPPALVVAPSRTNGAVSYPKSIRLMHQSIRNWQRYHFPYCSSMPKDVRERYNALKSAKGKKSGRASTRYWDESCRRMGMVDAASGAGIELGGEAGTFRSDDELLALQEAEAVVSSALPAAEATPPPVGKRKAGEESSRGGADGGSVPAGQGTTGGEAATAPMETLARPLIRSGSGPEEKKDGGGGGEHFPEVAYISTTTAVGIVANRTAEPRERIAGVPKAEMHRMHIRPPAAPELSISPPLSSGVGSVHRNHGLLGARQDRSTEPDDFPTAAAQHGSICPSPVLFQNTSVLPAVTCPPHMLQQNTRYSLTGSSQQMSAMETAQAKGKPDETPTAQTGGLSYSGSMSKEALLGRVRLAMEVVQAAAQIRPVTPLEKTGAKQQQETDLTDLGSELYELFSGQAPQAKAQKTSEDKDDSFADFTILADLLFDNDPPSDAAGQQQRKRERRRPGAGAGSCVAPLRDLGMPSALCRVVSSLMEESSDEVAERYESILEVVEDLRLLVEEPGKFLFDDNGSSTGELRIPHAVLYGRDEETSVLLDAFDRATGGANASNGDGASGNMVLVSGYSGTGKSSLVNGLKSTFAARGACFVSGKFDAMRQPQPLSAIVSALDDYCDILSRNEDRIESAREAVTVALGSEGAVLAGLIPNLRKIIRLGGNAPVQISGREALQRILFMFRMLFWATCSKAHPVVLFLDDLQWADGISLELMQVLVTDTMIEGLLFVGSYRDNEVGADHALTTHLSRIRQSGAVSIVSIHMANLDSRSVNHLVSETLHLTPRTTRSLAEVVAKKTGGNALFVVQFLATLHDDGLLRFSLTSKRWEWDIDQIRDKGIADNVVELMTAKLLRLAPEVQEALCVAASFGATCQEPLLNIMDRSPDRLMSTIMALDVAVSEGLMVKSGASYRFSHDQIQHASYLLVPESERDLFHLRIGRSVWKLSSDEETGQYLFLIVDQLHRGSSHITDCDEKVNLAQLSLLAAQMATGMSGFVAAVAYLEAGIGLLVDGDWERHRKLCFDLYNLAAETQYILGDFTGMTSNLQAVLQKANQLQEKLKAYFILVCSSGAQGRAKDAIDTTMTVLQQLGEPLPAVQTEAIVKQEMIKTQKLLHMKNGLLGQLEMMTDTRLLEAMKFLRRLNNYSFVENRQLFVLASCRMVQLTLSHGVSKGSAIGFAGLGGVLCVVGEIPGGTKVGKLALSLADKVQDKLLATKVQVMVHGSIYNWTQPMQASLPLFKESIDTMMSFGDSDFAMFSMACYTAAAFFSGLPLGTLMKEIQLHANKLSNEYKQHAVRAMTKPTRQAILNLLGRSANPIKLVGDECEIELSEESGMGISLQYFFFQMYLEYMFGEYELCWQSSKCNRESIAKGAFGRTHIVCNHTFYSCLAALALARVEVKSEYIEMIGPAMARMEKWVAVSPWNTEHKLQLLKAEYAYLQGDITIAAKAYDDAAETAAKHSFKHEQAVALERAGIFYLECGDHDAATAYFTRAHDCFCQWGAISKAAQLKEMYSL